MKPTHSTGTSFEGYELCPFCVPSYDVDSTAMGCKSCCCSDGKVAKKSNEESEVKYSPPPGVGLSVMNRQNESSASNINVGSTGR